MCQLRSTKLKTLMRRAIDTAKHALWQVAFFNPKLLTNWEKTLLVDALSQTYERSVLLVELGLAHRSYFYHQARLRGPDKYADARLAITEVFELNHCCYGYRRILAALGRQQLCLSEKVVRRLMK